MPAGSVWSGWDILIKFTVKWNVFPVFAIRNVVSRNRGIITVPAFLLATVVRSAKNDSDYFVPERWLQGSNEMEAQFHAQLLHMQHAVLIFWAGTRSCIGKSLSEGE